ncbi:MAG: hypothetical protein O3B97_04310 [Actinomycetota bacterium]|nr:hypothetical protein [Thermoleophilia bacterium]MDA3005862.1 hypothetical protein [Actinomycetota bacterium]
MSRGTQQGPRPEVLARLAVGASEAQSRRPRSSRARLLGLVLCAVTAGTVVGAIVAVGGP